MTVGRIVKAIKRIENEVPPEEIKEEPKAISPSSASSSAVKEALDVLEIKPSPSKKV
jgi:hypothetical protein